MNERIKVGDLVELIAADGYMPRLGSIGEVISGPDGENDYDVYFPTYPCPVPPGDTWIAHRSWLRKIPPLSELESTERKEEVPA